jgi:hypothetical protein
MTRLWTPKYQKTRQIGSDIEEATRKAPVDSIFCVCLATLNGSGAASKESISHVTCGVTPRGRTSSPSRYHAEISVGISQGPE